MTILLFLIAFVFVCLCWQDRRLGLLVLIASLPSYLLRFELLGVPSTLLELLMLAFVLVWLIKNCDKIRSLFSLPRLLCASLILFLVAGLIGIFISPDTTAALGIYKAYLVEPILLFLILRLELQSKTVLPQEIFTALGVSALILSAVACIQWVTGSGIPIPWDIERRVTSVFDYPNALGLFLGPIVVISVLQLGSRKLQLARGLKPAATTIFWLAITILSSLAIILAQSEAAIVAVLATLLIAGFIHKKTRILSSILLLLLLFLLLLLPPLQSKLTLQDYSGGVRLSQWEETISMLSDNWLFGAGLSGYPTALEPYHTATHYEIFQYPHNIFLNIWTELGLLGLIAFILLATAVLQPITNYQLPITSKVAILATVQIFIHGLVDVPYFKNDLAILTWILIAITLTYASKQTHQKKL